MKSADSADVELNFLIGLFYDDTAQLGRFKEVAVDDIPKICVEQLAHNHHMTVTVERFHKCPVDLKVLESSFEGDHYSRKIVLTRQSDNQVVMFGIVRLDLSILSPVVRDEVESQTTPLGRILINNHVWRIVKPLNLYEIQPGDELAGLMKLSPGNCCYGRTALIYCDGSPAIELLEIVAS